MGSDRARVSYDPSRHWRGVVYQEGRVTLEADWNEAETIAAEESREQLIDIIGPSGTPDDGYAVVPVVNSDGNATGDLTIQHGTLYVGGERMVLDTDLDYADQPDWVDTEGDELWAPPTPPEQSTDESVYLLLREQEVGAVEDPALLDIALGGPDTAERRRIVQRVVRGAIDGTTCADGLSFMEQYWERRGLTFDPATMQLESSATLQVSFEQDATGATPCDPVAQGGYLGAENQLIRVQIASVDEKGVPTLVWGFDNAYFMYRVTVGAVDSGADTTVLTLASVPVDSYHQPQKDQAVEVLVAAAKLTDTDYIAETTGIVTTVNTAYQPDSQEVVINAALASPTTDSPLLFLRVWQETIVYTGGAVELGTTGVDVTVTSSTGEYHVGDYWLFSVRPGTPTTVSPVYPQRILDAPQPPDGPRMWACPLAIVEWDDGTPTVFDCRQHFCQLVDACGDDGCCVDVSVDSVDGGAGLQAVIDRYASKGPVTICLQPGTYVLRKPLVITAKYRGLTIEACRPGVVIEAAPESPRIFLLGLILVDGAYDFKLKGVELRLPHVPLKPTAAQAKSAVSALPEERQALLARYVRQLQISIGVYVLGATYLSIENCTFVSGESEAEVFGAAIFAARGIKGLKLIYNNFFAPIQDSLPFSSLASRKEAEGALQVLVGYLQLPTRSQAVKFDVLGGLVDERSEEKARTSKLSTRAAAEAAAAASAIALPALADGVIDGNLFEGLTVPVLVLGRLGTIRLEENTVRACYGGFWLVHTRTTSTLSLIERTASAGDDAWEYIAPTGLASLGDPVFLISTVVSRILPVSPDETDPAGSVGMIKAQGKTLLDEAENVFRSLYVTASPQAEPVESEPKTRKARVVDVAFPKELSGLFHAASSVGKAEQVTPADPGTALVPRLEVSANQVDAVISDSDTGAGLLVLVVDPDHQSSLVCSHNRIRSRVSAAATVSLWELLECTLTGNIITNEAGNEIDRSVILVPRLVRDTALVAVTGNVLVGLSRLPARNLPAPFDTWDGLNTQMVL